MPKTPSTGFWHQAFLWRAANAGMLVRCHCGACRKTQHYLAEDLIQVFGGSGVIGELWGRCPRCRSSFQWSELERYPSSEDVGHLVIRRPNGFRHVRQWTDAFYGPPPHGPRRHFHLHSPIVRP